MPLPPFKGKRLRETANSSPSLQPETISDAAALALERKALWGEQGKHSALSATCDIEEEELTRLAPQIVDDILTEARAQKDALPKAEVLSGTALQPDATEDEVCNSHATSKDLLAVYEALKLSKVVLSKVRVLGLSYKDLLSQTQKGSLCSDVLESLCRPRTVQLLLRLCCNSMSTVEDDMIELQHKLEKVTKDENKRALPPQQALLPQQASASAKDESTESLKLKKVCFAEDAPPQQSHSVKKLASGLLSNDASGLSDILTSSTSAREVLGRVPLFRRMFSRMSTESQSTARTQSPVSQKSGVLSEASSTGDVLKSKNSKVSFHTVHSGLTGSSSSAEKEESNPSFRSMISQLSMETHHHDPLADSSGEAPSRSVKSITLERHFTDMGEVTQLLTEAKLGVWGRLKHRVPFIQYFFFGIWSLAIFALYRWQRWLCHRGLPDDCQLDEGWDKFMIDMQVLLQASMCLAVLTGMNQKAKFVYTFHFMRPRPRGFAFLALFFGTAPVWSLLTKVPFLQDFSLRSGGVNGGYIVLTAILIIFIAFLVAWHIRVGYKYSEGCAFIAYIGSRLVIIAFYIVFMVSHANAANASGADFHLHHYFIGWICASFAEFSHPLSLMLLAIGTGVFVQGIAAYGADGFITESGGVRMTFQKLDGSSYYSPWISQEVAQFFTQECFSR